ncbi:hypothetical protein EV651_119186 [Kribbella sp. VKM Ac-2571]|uniref:hypothetical protein n=1 Tax=Kribbella sp. VKM Ac-2571 TaxID=2512222 RepID=UPI0010EF15F4|nr:hypothetical protein [Kribbella sp. VKM Ac-2571]TDO51259.1 hypothetical protein EV651_119186 [Kribbella sp. VKM Ac-2571]
MAESANQLVHFEIIGNALVQAEELGGQRVFGPDGVPGKLVVGQFTDPEGNLIGVAGPR